MSASLPVRLCLALSLVCATVNARASDSQWTSQDYVDLYFRHFNGHVPLPDRREKVQAALFSHLIDPANITRIEKAPVSNVEKLRQLRIILAVLGSYRAAYNVAVIVGEPLAGELTEVQAYILEVAEHVANLVRLSPEDHGSPSAWATLVEGVIESVGDRERYTPAQSAIMADAIARHYPAIAAVLPEDERSRLRKQVLKLSDTSGNADLHEAFMRMKQAVLQ